MNDVTKIDKDFDKNIIFLGNIYQDYIGIETKEDAIRIIKALIKFFNINLKEI